MPPALRDYPRLSHQGQAITGRVSALDGCPAFRTRVCVRESDSAQDTLELWIGAERVDEGLDFEVAEHRGTFLHGLLPPRKRLTEAPSIA